MANELNEFVHDAMDSMSGTVPEKPRNDTEEQLGEIVTSLDSTLKNALDSIKDLGTDKKSQKENFGKLKSANEHVCKAITNTRENLVGLAKEHGLGK